MKLKCFDNSMLGEFRICLQRGYWRYVRGIVEEGQNLALDAGTTFHEGLATWYETQSVTKAQEALRACYNKLFQNKAEDNFWLDTPPQYTLQYLSETLQAYMKVDPLVHLGKVVDVEHGFALPLFKHPRYGELSYGGKIDLLIKTPSDALTIVDHKTTSYFSRLNYEKIYPSSQAAGYIWALANYPSKTPTQTFQHNYIIFRKNKPADFILTPSAVYTDADLKFWYEEVVHLIGVIKRCEELDSWPRNFNHCYAFFGACPYLPLCTTRLSHQEITLPPSYKQVDPWEPWKETN